MELLRANPHTGVRTYTHYEEDGKDLRRTIHMVQDVEPVVESNKSAQYQYDRVDKKRDIWKYADIPSIIQIEWMRQCGHAPGTHGFLEYAMKQLEKREWAYLRRMPVVKVRPSRKPREVIKYGENRGV